MTAQELRALAPEELKVKSEELKRKVFELRMALKTGRLDSTADIEKTKRDLARVNTLLRETELGIARKQ